MYRDLLLSVDAVTCIFQAFQKRRVAPFGQPVDVLVRPDYEDDAQPVIVENRAILPIRTTAPATEFQVTGATQAASRGMTCKGIVPKAKDLPHRAIMIVAEILDVLLFVVRELNVEPVTHRRG